MTTTPNGFLITSQATSMNAMADYGDYGNITENMGVPEFQRKVLSADEIIMILFYSLTFVIGITGNSLVVFSVTKYKRMRNLTNVFLTSLASADLLIIIVCIPIKMATFLSYTWNFGKFLCIFTYYMQNVSVLCSVLTLTTMTIERYFAIKHPLKIKSAPTVFQPRYVIIAIWFLAFIFASPTIAERKLQHIYGPYYWCLIEWPNRKLQIAHAFFQLLLMLIIPVCIMTYAYSSIARELKRVRNQRYSLTKSFASCSASGGTSSKASQKSKRTSKVSQLNKITAIDEKAVHKQIIKMLIIVVLLYVICWTPVIINQILVALSILPEANIGILRPIRQYIYLLSYANSCVNPIVYAFCSRNFRQSFTFALYTCLNGKTWARQQHYFHETAVGNFDNNHMLQNISSDGQIHDINPQPQRYSFASTVYTFVNANSRRGLRKNHQLVKVRPKSAIFLRKQNKHLASPTFRPISLKNQSVLIRHQTLPNVVSKNCARLSNESDDVKNESCNRNLNVRNSLPEVENTDTKIFHKTKDLNLSTEHNNYNFNINNEANQTFLCSSQNGKNVVPPSIDQRSLIESCIDETKSSESSLDDKAKVKQKNVKNGISNGYKPPCTVMLPSPNEKNTVELAPSEDSFQRVQKSFSSYSITRCCQRKPLNSQSSAFNYSSSKAIQTPAHYGDVSFRCGDSTCGETSEKSCLLYGDLDNKLPNDNNTLLPKSYFSQGNILNNSLKRFSKIKKPMPLSLSFRHARDG